MYPKLSLGLISILALSFIPFILLGKIYAREILSDSSFSLYSLRQLDYMFMVIILLGALDILISGFIPIIDKTHNYKEFGAPVIDVLFNTLSIFFSVVFVQTYLRTKGIRFPVYVIVILGLQIILLRRASIVWIVTSSCMLYFLEIKKVKVIYLVSGILILIFLSFSFGKLGSKRGAAQNSNPLEEFEASSWFKRSGIGEYNYMTYLYVSSPLANLQKNISSGDRFLNRGDFEDYFFYCLLPPSFTMRLENLLDLKQPVPALIHPHLIVGTCFMLSYLTLGYLGFIGMFMFILGYTAICMHVIKKSNTFYYASLSLLSTAILMEVFDNMLIRLDVIFMLFIYPVIFHYANLWLGNKKSYITPA